MRSPVNDFRQAAGKRSLNTGVSRGGAVEAEQVTQCGWWKRSRLAWLAITGKMEHDSTRSAMTVRMAIGPEPYN